MIRVAIVVSESEGQRQKSAGFCLLSIMAIAGMFLSVSMLSSSIPGVNEPHYLCKARSFSDPAWCARDFFLTSTNAHYCFFWLIGPLTQVVSLPTAALVGRGMSALILALGWTVLARGLGLSAAMRLCSMCVCLPQSAWKFFWRMAPRRVRIKSLRMGIWLKRSWVLDSRDGQNVPRLDDRCRNLLWRGRNFAPGRRWLDRRVYLHGLAAGFYHTSAHDWLNEFDQIVYRDRRVFMCDHCRSPSRADSCLAHRAG